MLTEATAELARLVALADRRIAERDAIADCFSPEWRAAHAAAGEACKLERAERKRLASLGPVRVPVLLSWDRTGERDSSGSHKMVPGCGEAGHGVLEFATLDAARRWARLNLFCATPCWQNAAHWGGVALGV